MTQKELYTILGVSKPTVRSYLKSLNIEQPYPENIVQLCKEEADRRKEYLKEHCGHKGNTFFKGHKMTELQRQKLKDAWERGKLEGRTPVAKWMKGHIPWNKGKTNCYSEETLAKMSNRTQFGRKRYYFNGKFFDSSWELIYFLAHPNIRRNENTKLSFNFNGDERYYIPDFIDSEGNYIEIKGPQFFENGKMINPFDRTMDDLYETKHQCMIANGVHIITDVDAEKEIVEQKYGKEYWTLFDIDLPFPYTDDVYKCHKKGQPSPIEAWNNMELRQKAIENRLKYGAFGERGADRIAPEEVVAAFSIMKIAQKVSVFSASKAKKLTQTYLNDCDAIVDPFAGFGGRLAGVTAAGKKYTGFDIEIKNGIGITQRDILSDYPIEEYDALFTCPPYSDKEEWLNPMKTIKSCDEWIDVCLQKFKCKKYLFVVDSTEKYSDYIVKEIHNNSAFGKGAKEYIILIQEEL